MPGSSLSVNAVPNEAPPAFDAPPPMPPPPYFKIHFIKPSSFKSAINDKVDKPLVSLFRLSVQVLQLIFALASGISYAIELRRGGGRGGASGSFVFSQVVFSATLLVLIINGVTVRYYRFSWMTDWTLALFWFALFAVFYEVYFGGDMTPAYGGVNAGRMEGAVWCDLVNALLWLGSALFSSTMCCSGVKASIKGKLRDRREKRERRKMMETMGEVEMGTIPT
ncbi:uncharacterized protein M421DRAFT_426472 [Didymella exigua CBS 183.55]|uniref:MARVEL domain-containing protein n=1 Tax=Didymella exigua CBS 183.55 TaxID=1150837 RepID=A0A6A5R635_9PLEO|nr:uncharacterized protein M421DRAFT_426472 [Didymella exigua CBS 183.55]KAF1922849.1 hypothetical protein M421DRAFT_426472 [Didymella exigua CBS 183.55]